MIRSAFACRLLLLGLLAGASLGGAAQTPEQLEALKSLPPEMQQKVLDQIADQPAVTVPPAPAAPTSMPKSAPEDDPAVAALVATLQPPRLRAGDSLLLSVATAGVEGRAQAEFRQRVHDGNPFRLDRMGRVTIERLAPIALAGLTESEAAQRLNADPALREFTFRVQLLPVEAELKPFGYDLFTSVPTTFAPASDIPVPTDYVIGPGDTFQVLLTGERGGQYALVVGRDGAVDFPELGPITVAGLRYEAARTLLEERVGAQMIGTRASVSMGPLRSIQIFVMGEAERPGAYTISGLASMTNALFASGGVKPIGSLRNLQLKRGGQVVGRLDLYDLLLNGDTSGDARLLPGDVIFIPPVGPTVAVSGEVQRPAIYEVAEGATAADALRLAGGLTPGADPRLARLERIDNQRNRITLDADLTTPAGRSRTLQAGDSLRIAAVRGSLDGTVRVEGHVHRPGPMQFRPGMRLTDLIGSAEELRPLADLHYVLIRRETGATRRVSVVSADLAGALAAPRTQADPELQEHDQVYVFDLASSRERILAPIIRDLTRQSGAGEALQVVSIGGRVKDPGQYPLEPGMRIGDLLRAAGGLDQAAYGGRAELTRYQVVGGESRRTELVEIDLAGVLAGDAAANVALQPFDYLLVREMPDWRELETITIGGEVRFPGTYPIRRSETLRSVIERAGGLSDMAFANGSVFTRTELKIREQRQLEVLAERLQRELAALSLQQARSEESGGTAEAMSAGQALLADLRATQAVGRLVIDLERVLRAQAGSNDDVIVKHGDQLFVPRRTQEVTVIGEVQSPTSHLYQAGVSRDDYILRSGGLTQRADDDRVFTIRANGSVAAAPRGSWFSRGGRQDIQPGDTIVVPLDAQQMQPLTVWTSVTQILYQIAVAVAAINSF